MTRDDIQKLLGGYATGTLTPEERQALFAAALEDQELFDALAKEQSLRDLLRDPAARAHVLAALDERPEPWWRWLMRPAAVGAMAACLAAVVGYGVWHARQAGRPVLVAANREAQVATAQSASPGPPAAEAAPSTSAPAAFGPDGKGEPVTAGKVGASRSVRGREVGQPPAAAPAPAMAGEGGNGAAGKPRKAAEIGSALARIEQPAPPQLEPSPAAAPAPALSVFEKPGTGVAGKENQVAAAAPAGLAGRPAPAPPQRAAAPSAPTLATLKKDGNGAARTANQGEANATAVAQIAGQPGPPPPPPGKRAAAPSAPAQPVFASDRKGAAGSVRAPSRDQTASSQADQLGAQGGASSESITVTADTTVQKAPPANNHRVADLPAAQPRSLEMAAAATPELKWSALRREPDGRLSPVEPDRIRAGDAIVLRLEPYADGTLSVAESMPGAAAPRVLMAGTRVKRAKAVDTPAVTLDHPGVRELLLRFTARTAGTGNRAVAQAEKRADAAPPAQTITLRFR